MCEADIFLANIGQDDESAELFLSAVNEVLPEGNNSWRLTSIFGEQKILEGRIRSMHLVDHRIIFEHV